MNKIEFDRNKCAWDHYKRPHMRLNLYREWLGTEYAPFVLFDTGEVISPRSDWKKDQRHHYRDQGVKVFSTADADAPELYYDTGEAVPKAHLTDGGGQTLLADEATGVVVGCGSRIGIDPTLRGTHSEKYRDKYLAMPSYFIGRAVSVYWPGPGREPVGSRIKVVRPIKRSKEDLAHCRDMKAAAMAWQAMLDDPEGARRDFWDGINFTLQKDRQVPHSALLKVENFSQMPESLRWKVTSWSITSDIETLYVEKLFLKQ